MPVGIERLLKDSPKEPLFEKFISKGLFDSAASLVTKSGYKKFGEILNSVGDNLPYLSGTREENIKIVVISAYRKMLSSKKTSKGDIKAFNTLESAMEFIKIKGEDPEAAQDRKKEEYKINRAIKEKALLKTHTAFRPLSKAHRVGVTTADIIVIGNKQRIRDALKSYEYTVEDFSINQVIIRGVTLLALRSDSFYVFSSRNDPVIKKKHEKGSWRAKLAEKRQVPRFTLSDMATVISQINALKKYKIVTKKYVRYEGHVYILLLPPTVIMLPYCIQKRGTIIPLINNWAILGIDN